MSEPHQIPSWVETARQYPLAFAQVREDPLLDAAAIRQLTTTQPSILMIASGGCTAAYLSAHHRIAEIDLVDANYAQLALTQYKLFLLEHHTPSERLQLLGHTPMPTDERWQAIENWCQENQYETTIFGPPESVAENGPDFVGRYELLFTQLQQALDDQKPSLEAILFSSHVKQHDISQLQASLSKAFQDIMCLDNLVALFGEEATQNPLQPFWQHFYTQTIQAITLQSQPNPYLISVLLGKHRTPPYMPWLDAKKQPIKTKLSYQHNNMLSALQQSKKTYDLIHLSNILDWLSEEQAKQLISLAKQRLNKNGLIIIRQLNSSLTLNDIDPELSWLKQDASTLLKQDRSYFYRNIILAQKP